MGRSGEDLGGSIPFSHFKQCLKPRGAALGKVALTLVTVWAPWTLCVLGRLHLCSRPKWKSTCAPSDGHLTRPKECLQGQVSSPAHGQTSLGRSPPRGHLWLRPWLWDGVHPTLGPWDVYTPGTCRVPGPECLQRGDLANSITWCLPGAELPTRHRGPRTTTPDTALAPMEKPVDQRLRRLISDYKLRCCMDQAWWIWEGFL